VTNEDRRQIAAESWQNLRVLTAYSPLGAAFVLESPHRYRYGSLRAIFNHTATCQPAEAAFPALTPAGTRIIQ